MTGDGGFAAALAAARAGDEAAFAQLFRAVQPALLRYLRTLAGEAAEDVAADAWVRVVSDLPRFDGDEAGFRAWVFTIARHRWVDGLRARSRRASTVEVTDEELAAVADPVDVAAAAVESESTRRALQLIATLPPDQAEAVLLRVVAGLDVERVAEIMGKRPGTVRVLSHRGLRRLAQVIDEDGVTLRQV